MFLHSVATAVPRQRLTQQECWQLVVSSGFIHRLKPRSLGILQKVLLHDSGIVSRHFATQDLASLFEADADALHNLFAREAPALAEEVLRQALDEAHLRPRDLDALFICTCTGYLCPGLTSYVAGQIGIRGDAWLHDTVGLGCGAVIPVLRNAQAFTAAHPALRVACVAAEICSAAFYLDDDPGVLISACLFSDGAAAAVIGGKPSPTAPPWKIDDFRTLHLPEHRESLRFENRGGKLRNRLEKTVPETAAQAVRRLHAMNNGHRIDRLSPILVDGAC